MGIYAIVVHAQLLTKKNSETKLMGKINSDFDPFDD